MTTSDIPIADLHPHPANPRSALGDLRELADSMRELGQLQSCVVAPNGSGYVVVVGHRRLGAAELLGWATLRCEIRDASPVAQLAMMLAENLQRATIDPIAVARTLWLMTRQGLTHELVGQQVGKVESWVDKHLALLNLSPELQEHVARRRLSWDVGAALSTLPPDLGAEVAATILANGWGGKRALAFIRSFKEGRARPAPEPLPESRHREPAPAPYRPPPFRQTELMQIVEQEALTPDTCAPRPTFHWPRGLFTTGERLRYLAAALDRIEFVWRFGDQATADSDVVPTYRASLPVDAALELLGELAATQRRPALARVPA